MKTIISILFLAVLSLNTSNSEEKRKITATVVNVTSNTGKVSFALYTKEHFLIEPTLAKTAKIVDGKSTVVFENVTPGEYAIVCYHDKNDNNTMDFQPNGMPMEDYGASNNIMTFGPPKYNSAKFDLTDTDVSLEIKF